MPPLLPSGPLLPWDRRFQQHQHQGRQAYYRPTMSAASAALPLQQAGGGSQQSSQQRGGRLQEVLAGIPLWVTVVTVICIILQTAAMILNWDEMSLSISAGPVIYSHEFYRLLTSAYFHGGFLHILMNMMSFVTIGSWLEVKAGTLYMAFTIFWSGILTTTIYVFICWLLAVYITKDYSWLSYASIGFSGVLFTLALIESYQSPPNTTRSIFGMFSVPSKLYPWVLLFIIQLMMPNISFLGHLSGILVGMLQVTGMLSCMFPSVALLKRLEASVLLSPVTRNSKYVPLPDSLSSIEGSGGACTRQFSEVGGCAERAVCSMTAAIGSICRRSSSGPSSGGTAMTDLGPRDGGRWTRLSEDEVDVEIGESTGGGARIEEIPGPIPGSPPKRQILL